MFKIYSKELIIDLGEEKIPPCWIIKNSNSDFKNNNYFEKSYFDKKVWISGGDRLLLNELIKSIDKAKELVCIASYIFNEPEIKNCLLNASKRGVRVYLITASNKHLKNQPDEDDEFNKKMYKEMENFFNEMQGRIKIRTSENFHTKFILIDPLYPNSRKGYLLTANFDTKGLVGCYIEKNFRVNPEICIILSDKEIFGFFNQFCYGFWEESTEEFKKNDFLPITKKINKNIILENTLVNSLKYKYLENAILSFIKENPGKLIITTYGIKNDNKVFKTILNELKRKREVIILTRPREKNLPALIELVQNGAKVLGHDDIHAKVFLIENGKNIGGIITTANIEEINFNKSFESGKILSESESKTISNILNKWIQAFPLELKIGLLKNEIKNEIRVWNKNSGKIEIKKVIEEKIVQLNPIEASSIIDYENFEINENELKKQKPPENTELFRILKYKYDIKPPILPKTAKEYATSELDSNKVKAKKEKKGKENFSLFKSKDNYYIVVKDKSEIQKVKNIVEKYKAKIITLEKYLEK